MLARTESAGGSTAPATDPTTTAGEPRLDLSALDLGDPDCGLNNGDLGLSYIWIANSTQGTISKIDTMTLQERGRYIARPDGAGNQSRIDVKTLARLLSPGDGGDGGD